MKDDTYNVQSYSDKDLYDILDLINPSDRELEAKILHMVWKYENIGNDSGTRLVNFFKEIYDHFFEEGTETETATENGTVEGFTNAEIQGAMDPTKIAATKIAENELKNPSDKLGYTFPIEYSKDTLNPLLKQTTKRIVSIDSQYRAIGKTQSGLSSKFTFNLSAPLKDVVNLKLYSVQIPYTWYTISDSYGSNFFYIKGNVPGIDNGNHDIKIEIGIGNYTAPALIDAVNTSITDPSFSAIYPDMVFDGTKITYDGASSKATIDLKFQKRYDESYYSMAFSSWSTPRSNIVAGIDTTNRGLSIPAFLGLDFQNYKPYRLLSALNILPWPVDSGDNSISNYEFDASNNYITIEHYLPGNTKLILETITITLTLALSPNKHTRFAIMTNVNEQLNNNTQLFNSSLQRLETESITGTSHSALDIRLNRMKTKNVPNSKIRIIFNESDTKSKIWTETGSAFCFENSNNELNTLISQVRTVQRKINIQSQPVMYFKCLTPYFNGKDANGTQFNSTDLTLNDFQITIPNGVYTLNGYINKINELLYLTGNVNRPSDGTSFETISINSFSYMDFKMDILKKFETGNFRVDMSDTFLSNTLKLTSVETDLSIQNIFTGTFPISGAGYTITGELMTLTPKENTPNRHVAPYIISGNGKTYADIQDLRSGLLGIFTTQKDDLDENTFMSDTLVTIIQSGNNATITLTIKVKKILSEASYKVSFIDTNADPHWSVNDTKNSWAYNLKIYDSSFNWSDYSVSDKPYSNYIPKSPHMKLPLYVDTITLNNTNNKIRFDPVILNDGGEGIYTDTMNNSVIVELVPNEYSRDLLFEAINDKLNLNPITAGTVFSGTTIDNADYTKISFNINKIYDPSDYRVVFYDPFSFVKCNVGSSSVQNTTWDSTLGWILGFRASTEYDMSDPLYFNSLTYPKSSTVTGDNVVSINIYNYFMIVLDDYNQSHMNSGIITTTQSDTDIPLPAYTNRALIQCDPITKMPITSTISSDGTNLTRSSIYAQQAIADDKVALKNSKKYSSGPFTKDVFALVPLKLAGLANNSVYVADGGTLQNQERTYFGPVNISRMTVKLVNDRGELVNLNGANWSFSFICEQLYKQ